MASNQIFFVFQIIWVALSIVGVLVNSVLVGEAWGDLVYLKNSGKDGALLLVANMHLRLEVINVLKQVLVLAIAVVIWAIPSPSLVGVEGYVFFAEAFFTLIIVLMVSTSILDYIDRQKLVSVLE